MSRPLVDVAIVGGGPAGTTTALALARRGYSVVVVERSNYQGVRIGETLPPVIAKLLGELGIWERFVRQGHRPSYGTRFAWGNPDLRENESIFNPYGTGWHVSRSTFDRWLAQLAEEAGVQVLRTARLAAAEQNARGRWEVAVAGERDVARFDARVLVDASGRLAVLGRRLGARRVSYDSLVGVVGLFAGVPGYADTDDTLVEAAERGWWYSAPLPDGRLVVAFMTDADLYGQASGPRGDRWQRDLEGTLHTARRINGRVLVPDLGLRRVAASTSVLKTCTGQAWIATGDAAMAFDPLSSLGICTAVETGLHAAEAVRGRLSAKGRAFADYRGWIRRGFDNYLGQRLRVYARERRWRISPFWNRRQAAEL